MESTHNSSAEKEVILVQVELCGRLQNLGAHLEGEEQLVSLEEAAARVLVDGVGMVVVEILDAFLEARVL